METLEKPVTTSPWKKAAKVVGRPGLEPGANGLKVRCAIGALRANSLGEHKTRKRSVPLMRQKKGAA